MCPLESTRTLISLVYAQNLGFIPRQSSFVRAIPRLGGIADEAEGEEPRKKRTRDGARARSKREDTSVTHESKLNNTAKSCINHPR